jgi:starch synthase (maltosyl-transferring)
MATVVKKSGPRKPRKPRNPGKPAGAKSAAVGQVPGAIPAPPAPQPVTPARVELAVPPPQFITVVIENVSPLVDGGRYPIKRAVEQDLTVEADIFMAGHDVITAVLKWRVRARPRWSETAMRPIPNGQDRWRGVLSVFENAEYEYTIEAWVDAFRSWQQEFRKKFEGGVRDLASETIEGAHLVESAAARAQASASGASDAPRLREIAKKIEGAEPREVNETAQWRELEALMAAWPDRALTTEYKLASIETGGYPRIVVDRERAARAACTSFFRDPPRVLAIAARPSAIASTASMTRRRWGST